MLQLHGIIDSEINDSYPDDQLVWSKTMQLEARLMDLKHALLTRSNHITW